MSKADEILFKIGKANKMTFDCINNCYIYEDCDGNRITITKEEQRIIDDYISPIKHIDWEKVKDRIEEYKNMLKTCNKAKDIDRIKAINERISELQELLEGRK